jgi:hypothetical protein
MRVFACCVVIVFGGGRLEAITTVKYVSPIVSDVARTKQEKLADASFGGTLTVCPSFLRGISIHCSYTGFERKDPPSDRTMCRMRGTVPDSQCKAPRRALYNLLCGRERVARTNGLSPVQLMAMPRWPFQMWR